MKLQENNLEAHCNQFFHAWQDLYYSKDFKGAVQLCTAFIAVLKKRYKNKELGNYGDDYTFAYVYLVLAKGLQDLAELTPLTTEKLWAMDGKKTETIWCKLWDTKQRFAVFRSHWLGDDILERITAPLDGLESYFYDTFGKGLYFSPDIIITKGECTVCKRNIKGCEHIPGNIYDGVKCAEKVVDMKLEGVSIVSSPHDMRCRLWPWNMNEDGTVTGIIMSLNSADSFIDEE